MRYIFVIILDLFCDHEEGTCSEESEPMELIEGYCHEITCAKDCSFAYDRVKLASRARDFLVVRG